MELKLRYPQRLRFSEMSNNKNQLTKIKEKHLKIPPTFWSHQPIHMIYKYFHNIGVSVFGISRSYRNVHRRESMCSDVRNVLFGLSPRAVTRQWRTPETAGPAQTKY